MLLPNLPLDDVSLGFRTAAVQTIVVLYVSWYICSSTRSNYCAICLILLSQSPGGLDRNSNIMLTLPSFPGLWF